MELSTIVANSLLSFVDGSLGSSVLGYIFQSCIGMGLCFSLYKLSEYLTFIFSFFEVFKCTVSYPKEKKVFKFSGSGRAFVLANCNISFVFC